MKQNGRRMLTRYASVSETEIPRIQEYVVPQNTKAIKFGIKIYKGWKRLTNPLPTFEQFQDMSLAITDFINLMYQSIETPTPQAPGHSGGLTRLKLGFDALLTARRPRRRWI